MTPLQPRTHVSDAHDGARQLESLLVQKLLESSGAFGASQVAGGAVRQGMFVEALANAVAEGGGFGLADAVERSLAPPSAPDLPPGNVTSPFGPRVDPLDGHLAFHHGVDLAMPIGTPVQATADGVVVAAGPRQGFGETVEVDHGHGVRTLYAHASRIDVHPGDRVAAGQQIALSGATGRVTGPHLHYEIRQDGKSVSPALQRSFARVDDRAEDLGRTFRPLRLQP